MAYCKTTRIEELSQVFNLDIQFDEKLDGFLN